jgi:hypothetical protein
VVLLLEVVVAHAHWGVAKVVVGECRAAGLVRFQGKLLFGGEGMSCPAPSPTLTVQVGVPRHRLA